MHRLMLSIIFLTCTPLRPREMNPGSVDTRAGFIYSRVSGPALRDRPLRRAFGRV
jgi:hypothetical protein